MAVKSRRRELVAALGPLLALAALSTGSALITEQQLGAVDWYRQYLGRVTHAVFAPANRPRVYVASEAGAVAALNLRNGSVVWRQVCSADAKLCLAVTSTCAIPRTMVDAPC